MEGITMPAFPKVDLSTPLTWVFNGVTQMVTTNLPLMIGVVVGISALMSVISYAKRTAMSAIH